MECTKCGGELGGLAARECVGWKDQRVNVCCTVGKGFDERVIAGLRGGRHTQQAELGEGSLEMNVGKRGNDGEGIFDGSRGKRFARPSRT